ncbi:MAG: WG repeat-containing protein, partial [Candidatus Kapabacteria bacterium]|nr:WG repeat-containing protein [Candidatus Kapabacteria bacterium]
FCIEDKDGIKWGFIDKEGQIKINPQFSKVNDFSDDICAVRNDEGKWGYIDIEGKIVINYQFDGAEPFINSKSVVKQDSKFGLIDKTGSYIINPQYTRMLDDGDMYLINQDGKYGWCDENGVIVINPQFNEAHPFNGNNLAAIRSGKSWGYIDKEGKIIINPQFSMALPFNGNMAMIANSLKAGFIDTDGKYIINPQYEGVSRDLVDYLQDGSSKHEIVETDFFDISAIISIIDFENPEGLTNNSNFADVIKKFNLVEENSINIWGNEHKVISNKIINNNANYDFFVFGIPMTDYELDERIKLTGFAYRISLSGNGYGKAGTLLPAIEEMMGNYKKNDDLSGNTKLVYSNEDKTIELHESTSSSVIIYIKIIEKEIAQKETTNEDDTTSNSENIEYYKIQDPDGYSNLRDKPKGDIVRKVLDSEKFEVVGSQGDYKKVKLSDGTIGFIHNSRVVKY